MFRQTRGSSRTTRRGLTSTTKKGYTKAETALKRKSLQEPAKSGGSDVPRSRSLSPGSAPSVGLKLPRGRGRPVSKKVTASTQKRESSIEPETTSKRQASKSLTRSRQSRVESPTAFKSKTLIRGNQSPKGGAVTSPNRRGEPKKGKNVEEKVEKDVKSPKVGAGKTSPKVTLRSRLRKETSVLSPSALDLESKQRGKKAVSLAASEVTSSRGLSSRISDLESTRKGRKAVTSVSPSASEATSSRSLSSRISDLESTRKGRKAVTSVSPSASEATSSRSLSSRISDLESTRKGRKAVTSVSPSASEATSSRSLSSRISDLESTRKGRKAVTSISPSASEATSSRSPRSQRKGLPLVKQTSGKGESPKPDSDEAVKHRRSLRRDTVDTVEKLKKETAKSPMKGAEVKDVKSESADDKPIAKRGRGRPKLKGSTAAANQKGKKRIVSSKVVAKKAHLTRARKLAAKAKQVRRGALRKFDESTVSDEEVDELLAEPSVFTKLKQDVPQQKSTKVEVGSVEALKKPIKRRAERDVGGVLQGRVEKRRGRKPGVSRRPRRKVVSRELAALSVDPGTKLGERKQNAGGRLRSVSSVQAKSLTIIKRARKGGQGLTASVRSPGSELGSDTTSLISRGMSPSSDTDGDSKKRVRKISPAARRCPFLVTRKRRSNSYKDYYSVRGAKGKFARTPGLESETSDTAADHTLLEKYQKFSATSKRGRSGKRRGHERGGLSSRLNVKRSVAVDSSLSEDTSAVETEKDKKKLPRLFKCTETSSMKALPSDTRTLADVKRSIQSNPQSISPLKTAEVAESKLSPSAQSIVTKSFSLKTIEKFKRAFKLVDPFGRSSSKDSIGSTESGGAETSTPDTKGKETVSGINKKKLPVNRKSKDLKTVRTRGNMVSVDSKPFTASQGIGVAKPAVENTDIKTENLGKVEPESKEQVNNVSMSSETSAMPFDSDTSFRLELSTDSSTTEELPVQNMDSVTEENVKKDTGTTIKAVLEIETAKDEILPEECIGKAGGSRQEEPMEIAEQVNDIEPSQPLVTQLETISKSETVVESETVAAEPTTVVMDMDDVIVASLTVVAESKTVVPESKTEAAESKFVAAESTTVVTDMEAVVVESATVTVGAERKTVAAGSKTVAAESPTVAAESKTVAAGSKTVAAGSKTVAAESKTVAAESKTVAAELSTVAAESPTVESKTVTAESKTVASELPTVAAELPTVVVQSKTAAAESKTVASELVTVAAESQTFAAESPTVAAESKTVAAESKTFAAESKTVAAELPTVAVELSTVAAESKTVAAESKTVAAESKIVDAESKTVAAESKTVASELPTVAAESPTVAAELLTVASESMTVTAESKTVAAESKTFAAESKTVAAELVTVAAESLIVAAESKTVSAESKTVAAESKTFTAESKTVAAELPTVAAELPTVSAESKTVAAESKTVAAESKTVAAESKTVAEESKTAESKTVAAESKTVAAESKTVAAESKTVAAESKTVAAESKTVAAESKTVTAESTKLVTDIKAVVEPKIVAGVSKTEVPAPKMVVVDSETVVAEATALVADLAALVAEAAVAGELKYANAMTVVAETKTADGIPLAEGIERGVLESKTVVAETPVVETKPVIAESDSVEAESKDEVSEMIAEAAEVKTPVESTAVSAPAVSASETKSEEAGASVAVSEAAFAAEEGSEQHGENSKNIESVPGKEAVETIPELVPEEESVMKSDEVEAGTDAVNVSKDEVSSKEKLDILSLGDKNESDPVKTHESIALNGTEVVESATPDGHDKKIKDDNEIVEDTIAKVVQDTVQSIVHAVAEKVESIVKEVVRKEQKDEDLEMQGSLEQNEQNASTSLSGDAASCDNVTSKKGPIILKIRTSALWKVDADGSGTSTGSGETEETLEDAPVGDGVVVSSSQEVLEASAMSRKVKDALDEVNKTLSVVAAQEVVKEDACEPIAGSSMPAQPSAERVGSREEEAVTSTAEHLQDEKTGKYAVGDECLAVASSKEDGVSCSCHPSGKESEQPAEPEPAPIDAAAAAELGIVEEEAPAPVGPEAPPPKLATASMVEVERRIEEIQAMVSDIQKQIKTSTGTSKVGPGIRPLDTEYHPYGPRNINRPDEKGDLKLTIKLGSKKGDATAAFTAGETRGVEKKGGKKHVEETKTYPKRHVSPKYSDLPWVEYSESYFEDMARKQKKSLAKLEGKQEQQIGDTRPKRKPVRKTEYELYMYELKNPKRRKHKSGPTSMMPGSSTITSASSFECLIDHVVASTEEKKPSNIPELLKLCKPCCIVLEDFVVNLNLSALKRKQSADGQEIHLEKRPRLNVGDSVYNKAEIDTEAIAKQLSPDKQRRSTGSRSGRRASGSSSTGSLTSELESGRLSPSSPRALDVPANRLSPKPHKKKVNRTGFPKPPRKYYYVYQCKFCPYSTNYRIAMDDHVYTHLDVVPFRCGYCNSVFGAKSGAVMHHKRNHQNLALRCIKSVEVDESQYYNYVYVTGGRHKTPVGAQPVSPPRAGGKETRNVFESIMKEIPTSGADAISIQTTAPVPIAAVAPMASAQPRTESSHAVDPGQKIMHPAQLPTQTKPPILSQAKLGLPQANPVRPAQTLSKSPHSDKLLPVYQCKFCKFSTDHRNVIETHLQHYHEEEYRFICPLCDLAFCKREETMVKHFKKWHPGRNVMFKRAPGYKDREIATSDGGMSYQSAALKSLRPEINDAQVSKHDRLLAATSAPILPAATGSAPSSSIAAQNVSNLSTPVFQLRKQQASESSQSTSPGPESGRKSNKPSITDIAANLASKVGGIPSDTSKSSNPVFLNIPDVRSRGSSPSAPDKNQGGVQSPLATGVARKPAQDVRAPVSGGRTGILDLSKSSRESTPVPAGSTDSAAQGDVSNLKIVNVVSLSKQEAAPVFSLPETEEMQYLIYCCKNCKMENSVLDEVIKHIEAMHSQMDFWFACPYCPYGCSKHRGNMVRHIRRAHPAKEASEIDIHLIDETKYISKRFVTTRRPRNQNVSVVASTAQPVQMQQFTPMGPVQMTSATQLAQTRVAPPLIPMVRAPGNQQRNLPPPLIRAVAMTAADLMPVSSSSALQSMRPGPGHHMSATPSGHTPQQTLPGQTRFPPPNAQVFQGVPHQGVTHMTMSQPSGGMTRFPMNPRMAAVPAPKQNNEKKAATEQEKFSVFNLRPTNPSVFPQASQIVTPVQTGGPIQFGHPGMVPLQRPFAAAPPVRGQNPGQVPYRPPQPPTS